MTERLTVGSGNRSSVSQSTADVLLSSSRRAIETLRAIDVHFSVSGFGPNEADKTFGLDVVFQKAPPRANSAPSEGYQFFGQLDIDHRSQALTVVLKDLNGASLYTKTLEPQRA